MATSDIEIGQFYWIETDGGDGMGPIGQPVLTLGWTDAWNIQIKMICGSEHVVRPKDLGDLVNTKDQLYTKIANVKNSPLAV